MNLIVVFANVIHAQMKIVKKIIIVEDAMSIRKEIT